ncbi:WD40/YVTN/BNR-like repeat-containing protein [Saccharothrix luteola]|uniref:WD40/YVTN/BNR-like repeat-containing protein n=1 Tax=Saccharothrix luteola TaxID=2893018 RepID=UPI001E6289F3|nr:hypothetical protein [Saccharothrix luteola]MCC8246422.1 hypothetical protein [Saccharothrix luteola]
MDKLYLSHEVPYRPDPADRPAPAHTTHKIRARWFQARESWPWRESDVDLLNAERARAAAEVPAAPEQARWLPVGPSNIGGRMTCAVVHPDNARRIWAGAAGGGVWQSDDGGETWETTWHDEQSLNIGALAIDAAGTLYCGTGEANLSADSHPGVGLFRSTDGGASWHLLAPAATTGLPRRIGALVVDPANPRRLFVGGVRHSDGGGTGLFTSADGGLTWARVPIIGQPYRCHDVQLRDGRVYVTIDAQGVHTGIWRSVDGGGTWQHLTAGLPSGDRFIRTSIAIAPSAPDVLYALMGAPGVPSRVVGPFRSDNGGDTWKSVGGPHFADERQMNYNNTIVVHPEDPDQVLCAGVDIHRTADGGRTWTKVTDWRADRGKPDYAHADNHRLVMPRSEPGLVYALNDGGMDVSEDAGRTWRNRSTGLATNMFYDLAVAQTNGDVIGGGAQDNGTLVTGDGTADGYFELTGGDGGWIVIDPGNVNHLFSTWQNMNIARFRSDGAKLVTPPESEEARKKIWMVFVAMDPDETTTLFCGSRRVWRTTDDGDHWEPVSAEFDDSPISAIEVSRGDSDRIYVGTENGAVHRSTDGGDTWSGNLASTLLPSRMITRLESRPDDADVVFATVANTGGHHVFRSDDGGLTWTDVDGGRLPDVPFSSIAIPAAHPNRVYVCCDVGVFVSEDGGGRWANLTGNLPTVMVVDLVYHEQDRTLTAATYGRSIWRLDVD